MGLVALVCALGVYINAQAVVQDVPAVQKTWFEIGYKYDAADKPEHITALRAKLPGTPSPALLKELDRWAKGEVQKDKVRPLLVAHAKTIGGWEAVQAFRLGEWCSQLEDTVLEFMVGAMLDRPEVWASALFRMPALTAQAQGFIDTLSTTVPEIVIRSLESIVQASQKIDVLGVYFNRVSMDDLIKAVLSIPDNVSTLKRAYGG
ncbi:MAG: hypothetical protein NZ651_05285 [Candidatus Bipolaricaulota bacterium]|nr:hypothetical protein [Candidatus Bipolaricaulota bacterium]MDW8127166.1 hypothetical protein [Candidatus Bipolaricaulota bacterium]